MSECERDTAYCGLYCRDCIPSDHHLFELAGALQARLEEVGFEHYAALKSRSFPVFQNYPRFREVLEAIGARVGMSCSGPCREGGGNTDCRVRACCQEKGYRGCWECAGFRDCALLQPLRDFHGDNINHNLEVIRQHGPANWADERGKHYPWRG